MTEKIEDNIIGFYASFNPDESNQEIIRSYIWSDKGLKNKLVHLKWKDYGKDLVLILFEFYIRPIPAIRSNLKEIGSYRSKEKSIGIPIILDNDNFFKLTEIARQQYLAKTIVEKLDLVGIKVRRNKLNFNISSLIADVKGVLNKRI